MNVSCESDAPTAGQLFKLSDAAVTLAKSQERLRASQRYNNAHLYILSGLEYVEIYNERLREISHKFMGRIARVGYKCWSMKLVEQFQAADHESEDSLRTIYSFKWLPEEVIEAKKSASLAPLPGQEDCSELDIREFKPDLIAPDWFHAINQCGILGYQDVQMLIRKFSDYGSTTTFLASADK